MNQSEMFTTGEDLPIFSGAPVRTRGGVFKPAPVARQESMIDLRPDPFQCKEPQTMSEQRETYADPRSLTLQQETGLTALQIVRRAKTLGLRTRKIYGRVWINAKDIGNLKASEQ